MLSLQKWHVELSCSRTEKGAACQSAPGNITSRPTGSRDGTFSASCEEKNRCSISRPPARQQTPIRNPCVTFSSVVMALAATAATTAAASAATASAAVTASAVATVTASAIAGAAAASLAAGGGCVTVTGGTGLVSQHPHGATIAVASWNANMQRVFVNVH